MTTKTKQLERVFLDGVVKAFQSPTRIEFPTHEDDYDKVHFKIHQALEMLIDGFRVGDGSDVLVAGKSPYLYDKLYNKTFKSDFERESFLAVPTESALADFVFSFTISKFDEYTSNGFDPRLVARVLHDAVHHLVLFRRGERMGLVAATMRPRMFSAYYQLKATEGIIAAAFNMPDIPEMFISDLDASDMLVVCKQIELDVGLSHKLIFGESHGFDYQANGGV